MRPIILLAAPALAACALLSGCATHTQLTEMPMMAFDHPPSVFHATNPRMPDGVTAYAMADIDTSRNAALATFLAPHHDYPSVGGDIVSEPPVTPGR